MIGEVRLRKPEPEDLDALYIQKNDSEVAALLGGFTTGLSRRDLSDWLERHRTTDDEVLWTIADKETDRCLGHVGLYRIDHRIGRAEFAIMIGERSAWGRGIGSSTTRFVLRYGFEQLALQRIELSVLANNDRAIELYRKLGFKQEGLQRRAQYKDGRHLDVILMAILREELHDS